MFKNSYNQVNVKPRKWSLKLMINCTRMQLVCLGLEKTPKTEEAEETAHE